MNIKNMNEQNNEDSKHYTTENPNKLYVFMSTYLFSKRPGPAMPTYSINRMNVLHYYIHEQIYCNYYYNYA